MSQFGWFTPVASALSGKDKQTRVVIKDTKPSYNFDEDVISMPPSEKQGSEIVRGMLDHEIAKARLSVKAVRPKRKSLRSLLMGMLDDGRIDRLMSDEFPGCGSNTNSYMKGMLRKTRESTKEIPNALMKMISDEVARLSEWLYWTVRRGKPQAANGLASEAILSSGADLSFLGQITKMSDIKKAANDLEPLVKKFFNDCSQGGQGGEGDGDGQGKGQGQGQGQGQSGAKGEDLGQGKGQGKDSGKRQGKSQGQGQGQGQGQSKSQGQGQDQEPGQGGGKGDEQDSGGSPSSGSGDEKSQDERKQDLSKALEGMDEDDIESHVNEASERVGDKQEDASSEIFHQETKGMRVSDASRYTFNTGLDKIGRQDSRQRFDDVKQEAEKLIAYMRNRLLAVLKTKGMDYTRGLRRGQVDPSALFKVPTGEKCIFRRRMPTDDLDISVSILLDRSNSMGIDNNYHKSAVLAYAISKTLEMLKVPNEVLSFTTETSMGYGSSLGRFTRIVPLQLGIVKEFREGVRGLDKGMPGYLYDERGWTPTGEGVDWAAKRLSRQRQNTKLLIVLTDGYPCLPHLHTDIDHIVRAHAMHIVKKWSEKMNILGICTMRSSSTMKKLFPRHVFYDPSAGYVKDFYEQFVGALIGHKKRQMAA